jgi:hypothetical protein
MHATLNSPTPHLSVAHAILALMKGSVGDTIVVESERVSGPVRIGVIEEVLKNEPPRYQVRWEDGHSSILSPSAGSTRIERAKQTKRA